MTVYIIRSIADPGLYWSENWGWVVLDDADLYMHKDVDTPQNGIWVTLEEQNA